MTVEELITQLGDMPADADVYLMVGSQEAEGFIVEISQDWDGWVVLRG